MANGGAVLKGLCADSSASGSSAEEHFEKRPDSCINDLFVHFRAIGLRGKGLLEYSPGKEANVCCHHALALPC